MPGTWLQGWVWVNEGKSPLRPKWGYVTEQMGSSLLVKVRTSMVVLEIAGVVASPCIAHHCHQACIP